MIFEKGVSEKLKGKRGVRGKDEEESSDG